MKWKFHIVKNYISDLLYQNGIVSIIFLILFVLFSFVSFDYQRVAHSFAENDVPKVVMDTIDKLSLRGVSRQSHVLVMFLFLVLLFILYFFFGVLSINKNKDMIFKFQKNRIVSPGYYLHFLLDNVGLFSAVVLALVISSLVLVILNQIIDLGITLLSFNPWVFIFAVLLYILLMSIRYLSYRFCFSEKKMRLYFREQI